MVMAMRRWRLSIPSRMKVQNLAVVYIREEGDEIELSKMSLIKGIKIYRPVDIQIYKHRNYISGECLTKITKDHFLPAKSQRNAFIHQEQKIQNGKKISV